MRAKGLFITNEITRAVSRPRLTTGIKYSPDIVCSHIQKKYTSSFIFISYLPTFGLWGGASATYPGGRCWGFSVFYYFGQNTIRQNAMRMNAPITMPT